MFGVGTLGPVNDPPPLEDLWAMEADDLGPYQLYEYDPGNPQLLWWSFTAPVAGTYVFDGYRSLHEDGTQEPSVPFHMVSIWPVDNEAEQGWCYDALGEVGGYYLTMTEGQTIRVGALGGAEYTEEGLFGAVVLSMRVTSPSGVTRIPALRNIEDAQVLSYTTLSTDGTVELPLSVAQPDVEWDEFISYRHLLICAAGECTTDALIEVEGLVLNEDDEPEQRVLNDSYQVATNRWFQHLVVSQNIPASGMPGYEGSSDPPVVTITFPEALGNATVVVLRWQYHPGSFASQPTGTPDGQQWANSYLADPDLVGPAPLGSEPNEGDYFNVGWAAGGFALFANWPDNDWSFDPVEAFPNLSVEDIFGNIRDEPYPDGYRYLPEQYRRLLPEGVTEESGDPSLLDINRLFIFDGSSQLWLQNRPGPGPGEKFVAMGLIEVGGAPGDTFVFVPFGTEGSIIGEPELDRRRFTGT